MKKTEYQSEEASKYSKLSLQGEGTLYLSFRDLEELIQKHFPTSSFKELQAVDYGCGAGRSTRYLKSLGVGRVDGFDISDEMIQEAQKEDPQGRYELISSAVLPVPDATYDLALLSFVTVAIENKEEMVRIFNELNRVLKPGGQVLSITLSETFWDPKREWVSYKQDYPENYNPKSGQKSRLTIRSIDFEIADCYWLETDIIGCAKEAGLSPVEVHPTLGNNQDGIVWKDESQFAPYSIFSFTKQ